VPEPGTLSRRARGSFDPTPTLGPGDAVVVLAEERDSAAHLLDPRLELPDLSGALGALAFTAKPGTTTRVPLDGAAVTVVGVRPGASAPEVAAAAATGVRGSAGARRVLVDVPGDRAAVYSAAVLATYRFDAYKAAASTEVAEVVVVGDPPADLDRVDDLVAAICFARDVTTLPPADKTPQRLARRIADAAAEAGAQCRLYDEAEVQELGMNGLLAVAQASAHRPVLVRLSAPGTGDGTVAVVGKGLTYDAGGLNLKLQMLEMMKLDVGGAAAAVGAVLHAARFPRSRGLTVWVGLCENVISGDAYRGGDVLRMRNGLTVEVANTDAEGRLTLADGMSVAAEESPDVLVTIATLTGSAMAALGRRTAALMTEDDDLAGSVLAAADRAGEDLWRMPMRPHFSEPLESQVADLNNLGDLKAQTMIAAAFLSRFAPDGTPYAHLDIAAPAYNPGKPYAHVPHGGTGYGVGTLVELLDGTP
jgi:leucyl aminopeptidase